MSLLLMRAGILAQGGDAAPPPPSVTLGAAWQLDVTRRPPGYSLSDGNQTAINTSGGSDYRRWVPTAKPILPADGRRYWEVRCADSGAASFDGHIGVVSQAMRSHFDTGWNPVSGGSIGWRGNGELWSSDAAPSGSSIRRLTGLPPHGAGDVLMFVLDPASASLWIGLNGLWHDDPVSGAPTWSAAASPAFYPVIQGRNPGDGGTLRSLPAQFGHPWPAGTLPLGAELAEMRINQAALFIQLGRDDALTVAGAEALLELGGGTGLTDAQASLYIELELP